MVKKEKPKNKPMDKKMKFLIFYSVLLTILIVFIAFSMLRSYNDYHAFKSHREYLRNNFPIQVESWMTPHTVLRRFNITSEDLFSTLNVTNSSFNLVKPISTICTEKKENCTIIVQKLNNKLI